MKGIEAQVILLPRVSLLFSAECMAFMQHRQPRNPENENEAHVAVATRLSLAFLLCSKSMYFIESYCIAKFVTNIVLIFFKVRY